MATAAERQALLFLMAVALLGGAVRVVAARRFERQVAAGLHTRDSTAGSVDGQLAAVDSARSVRSSRSTARGSSRTSRRPPKRPPARPPASGQADPPRSRSPGKQPTLSRGEQRAPIGPVDVNTATAEALEQLPRVGPALAGRIVAYRAEHGAYRSIDDLRHVRGIGVTTAALLAPLVTFSGGYRPIPE
jgi:competence ComEA-like helix-hairpin-helix protein